MLAQGGQALRGLAQRGLTLGKVETDQVLNLFPEEARSRHCHHTLRPVRKRILNPRVSHAGQPRILLTWEQRQRICIVTYERNIP